MTIYQTARFQVRPEALEQCERAIRETEYSLVTSTGEADSEDR